MLRDNTPPMRVRLLVRVHQQPFVCRDSPMTCATLRNTDMQLTENPVCVKRVLKAMPRLSPQLVMQKALKVMMKKVGASRWRPQASTARTEKTMQLMISKGVVIDMYVRKKASTPYTRSS
jgi:hypothetical protein